MTEAGVQGFESSAFTGVFLPAATPKDIVSRIRAALLKVLDLGLALVQGEGPGDRTVVGGQGYVIGTMDYLSPEQAEDQPAGQRERDDQR